MELKMYSSERLFSRPFLSRRNVVVKSSPRLCSCTGISPKVSYLSTSNKAIISSVGQENFAVETFQYHINGTSGANSSLFFREMGVLDAFDDEYGGVMVNPERLPPNPKAFASRLHLSLSHWKTKGKKGVWLKLPLERSELVPLAVEEGFKYHHAERGYVMLTYWIPEGLSMLPANASHQVGVGGFVINDKNEVLVVQEKHCSPALAGLWKIPTGFILESEEIFTGAVREVKEETGGRTLNLIYFFSYLFTSEIIFSFCIKQSRMQKKLFNECQPLFIFLLQIDTEFVEVIAFRHAHNVAFEKSDLFFICMLKPLSAQIIIDDLEVQAAKWMPLVEFVEQPLIKGDCMFKKVTDICIARLGKCYCGLSSHQLVSKFDGRLSSLYCNVVEDRNFNCQVS